MGIFSPSSPMWMRYGCENIRFVKELLSGREEKQSKQIHGCR